MKEWAKLLRNGRAFEWGLTTIAFCLPLNRSLTTFVIVITALLWLAQQDLGSINISKLRNPVFILFAAFYTLHLISYILSQNKSVAGTDLEVKLSLLIFPLFFLVNKGFNIDTYNRIARAFVLGCILAIIFCIYYAFIKSFNNPYTDSFNISIFYETLNYPWWKLIIKSYSYFNYSQYSYFIHPSYFALYLTFASFIVTSTPYWYKVDGLKGKIVNNIVAIVLGFNIFLLQSRAGFIAMFFYLIWVLLKSSLRTKQLILFISALTIIFVLLFNTGRFMIISKSSDDYSWSSIKSKNLRVSIWKEAVDLIKERPVFGHGIGDAKYELIQKYKEDKIDQAWNEKLNAHNDFLEVGIKTGIIGILILLFILFYPFFIDISQRSSYLFFISIILIHFTFESMLERFAGVIFFSFFYCYLVSFSPGESANRVNTFTK